MRLPPKSTESLFHGVLAGGSRSLEEEGKVDGEEWGGKRGTGGKETEKLSKRRMRSRGDEELK